MPSNYKRLGDYIKPIKEKNTNLEATNLLGINVNKFFMPSVANVIGTDMSNYRIVNKNQFACNRMHVGRDYRIPIALSKEDIPFMVSPAYDVFEIIDVNILLPEYLMMWFSRKEFDRNAWFHTDADVRGGLPWNLFCDLKLPIPSIKKQEEIVREYHIIKNRIFLNNYLITKLEETAEAIYKQWFVDFEFPDENGKPYKSNGGEMIWCEELEREIPEGWDYGSLGDLSSQFAGFSFKGEEYSFNEGITVVRGENVTEKKLRWDTHKKWNLKLEARMKKCFLEANDIVIGMDGSKVGKNWAMISKYDLPLLLAQRVTSVRSNTKTESNFILLSMMVLKFEDYVSQVQTGTSVPHISGKQISDFPMLIPSLQVLESFNNKIKTIYDKIHLNTQISNKLEDMKNLLLAKITTIEKL